MQGIVDHVSLRLPAPRRRISRQPQRRLLAWLAGDSARLRPSGKDLIALAVRFEQGMQVAERLGMWKRVVLGGAQRKTAGRACVFERD